MAPRSVLLVDDNATFLRHAERFLGSDRGLRVVGAVGSVAEAVARARALQPDVVLLDLSMPDADGFDALPLLREAAPSAVVVVLTMLEDESYRVRALGLGAHGFVTKGRLVDDLLPEVHRLCPAVGPAPSA